jgi:hypothetical protein
MSTTYLAYPRIFQRNPAIFRDEPATVKERVSMKRILVVISSFIVLFTVNNVFASGAVKFGLDSEGDHKSSDYWGSETLDVEKGVSLSAEFFGPIGNTIDMGGGFSIQAPRALKDFAGDFSFIPFYFAIRTRFVDNDTTPYFIGQLGYNFFFGDSDYKDAGYADAELDGGLYWGLGGGIIINKHFLIELLYTENNGTADVVGDKYDIKYTKMTLNFGFNF